MKIWLKAVLRLKRVLTSFIPKPICDIILSISTGGSAILLPPVERDIDPGNATRRRFCATQTRRSPEILPLFHKRRTTWLRDVRTRLGRLLVLMYSSLACGRATGEYMRRGTGAPFSCM